jgi:chromosome segregation ATPase
MTLNISSKVLKIVCIVLACLIVAGGITYGVLRYRNDTNILKNENKTLTEEKTKVTSNYEACDKELVGLKEKYGIALSDAEKAQSAASKASAEATKQKTAAQQANTAKTEAEQNLSNCAYYFNVVIELADVLDAQKQYYKAASVNMANAGSAMIDGNFDAALYYANLANDNSETAASYESRVNTLLRYFE